MMMMQNCYTREGWGVPNKNGSLFITGGGAYNNFLISRMQHHLPKMELIIPAAEILEFKEALIFGLLACILFRGRPLRLIASFTMPTFSTLIQVF